MPKASVGTFAEDPTSRERNQYVLKRTARLADQLETLSDNVNGSSVFFFDDTLAKAHNLRRSPRIKWGGRFLSLPRDIKKEFDVLFQKASDWATNDIQPDIVMWKAEDNWDNAQEEYIRVNKVIEEWKDGGFITLETYWTQRAKLCQIFRDKFMTGTLHPEAHNMIIEMGQNEVPTETLENRTEADVTEAIVPDKFQQTALEFDEIHHKIKCFKDSGYITELEYKQRLVKLGRMFAYKGYTGCLYPDANELMKDIYAHQHSGDPVANAIEEYDSVLKILDEAKAGRYPPNSEIW